MMNKKQIYSTILACVAISAILVASSLIAGIQFTQPALAQTAAAPTPPPPAASTKKTAAAAGEPPLGKQVNWQGVVSSLPSGITARGRGGGGQIAVILPPRKDSGVYTGVITYTASKPVTVEIWHQLNGVSATTLIPRAFGAIALVPSTGKSYALAIVGPTGASASVPFAGNGVALRGSSPFIAAYSMTATTSMASVKNNLTSASTAATLGSALGGGGSAAGGASLGGLRGGSALGGASLGGGSAAGGATLGTGTTPRGG